MPNSQAFALTQFYAEMKQEIRNIATFLPNEIISWRIFWYSLPISIITTTIFLPNQITFSTDLAKWVLIGFISHMGMAPFVFYANSNMGKWIQILLSFSMGGVRGAVISLLAPIMGIDDSVPLLIRVMNSAIAVFYWVQMLAIFLQIRSTYKMKLQELLRQTIFDSNLAKKLDVKNSAVLRHEQIVELIGNLKTTISKDAQDPLSVKQQIHAIDELIDKHIKPQSSKRWERSEVIWPTLTFRLMLRDSLSRNPVPIFAITILSIPLSLTGAIVRDGFFAGTLYVVLFAVIIFAIYLIGRKLIHSKDGFLRFNLFIFVIATVAIYPLINLIFNVVLPDARKADSDSFIIQALSMLLYDAFVIAGSILFLHQRARSAALDNLESVLSTARIQSFLRQGSRAQSEADMAQYLHAEVQAQLYACKLLLLRAAESDFRLFSPQVTTMVVKRLESLQVPYVKAPPKIPSQRVKEIVRSWTGLSTITSSLPPELDEISLNGEVIAQLIEESVMNSIRHGKAKFINIKGEIVGDICHIVITNDGQLTIGNRKGLGTILFDTFANNYQIDAEPGGTQVSFSIPLAPIEIRAQE